MNVNRRVLRSRRMLSANRRFASSSASSISRSMVIFCSLRVFVAVAMGSVLCAGETKWLRAPGGRAAWLVSGWSGSSAGGGPWS